MRQLDCARIPIRPIVCMIEPASSERLAETDEVVEGEAMLGDSLEETGVTAISLDDCFIGGSGEQEDAAGENLDNIGTFLDGASRLAGH